MNDDLKHAREEIALLEQRIERLEAQKRTATPAMVGLLFGVTLLAALIGTPWLAYGLGPVPHGLANGTPVDATDLNENFQHIVDAVTAVEARFVVSPTPEASGSVDLATSNNSTYADVTSLDVDVTTSGNPMMLGLVPGPVAGGISRIYTTDTNGAACYLRIIRGSTPVCEVIVEGGNQHAPTPSLFCLDPTAPAGTHNYRVQARVGAGGDTVAMSNMQLIAMEQGWRAP